MDKKEPTMPAKKSSKSTVVKPNAAGVLNTSVKTKKWPPHKPNKNHPWNMQANAARLEKLAKMTQ